MIPARSEIMVRVTGADYTVSALATRPLLSAAALTVRGFVFEQQRFTESDIVPGPLVDPVILFPLTDGVDIEWNRGESWYNTTTRTGSFVTFPSASRLDGRWRGELDALVFSFDLAHCRLRIPDLRIPMDANLRTETNGTDGQLWHLAQAIKTEAEAGCPAGRAYAEAIALAMSVSLLSRHGAFALEDSAGHALGAQLHTVLQYIKEHIGEDLRLDTLAAVAKTTPDNFRRVFREVVGIAPHQYVLQQRVERAEQLLSDPTLTVAQVAYAVGFSSQAHFATVFHKFRGISPKAYRERLAVHSRFSV